MRGATISCVRPKYDVVARRASKTAWLAKDCVVTPQLFWPALELSALWSSTMMPTARRASRWKLLSARSESSDSLSAR